MPRRGAYTKLGNKTSPLTSARRADQSPRSEVPRSRRPQSTTSQGPSSGGLARGRKVERVALSSVDREKHYGVLQCAPRRESSLSRTFDLALPLQVRTGRDPSRPRTVVGRRRRRGGGTKAEKLKRLRKENLCQDFAALVPKRCQLPGQARGPFAFHPSESQAAAASFQCHLSLTTQDTFPLLLCILFLS
jgi:hypothetical protein